MAMLLLRVSAYANNPCTSRKYSLNRILMGNKMFFTTALHFIQISNKKDRVSTTCHLNWQTKDDLYTTTLWWILHFKLAIKQERKAKLLKKTFQGMITSPPTQAFLISQTKYYLNNHFKVTHRRNFHARKLSQKRMDLKI